MSHRAVAAFHQSIKVGAPDSVHAGLGLELPYSAPQVKTGKGAYKQGRKAPSQPDKPENRKTLLGATLLSTMLVRCASQALKAVST